MIGRQPDDAALAALLAPELDVKAVGARLAAAGQWGARRSGEFIDGDGSTTAAMLLTCARGVLAVRVTIDPKTGRITRLSLGPGGDATCVP